MALTIAFIVSLIAVANAGFPWMDNNQNNWSPFPQIKMPNIQFPSIPLPQMPHVPTIPQAPRFPFAGFQMPYVPFPKLLTPADIAKMIPSPEEMAKVKPGPNQAYNGVAVKSTSGFTKDKDGKLVKTGGTTILVNDNGDVLEKKIGNNPPNLNDPIIMPSMPPMPEFKPFVMPPMQPIKPIKINSADIENHKNGDNEHFVGTFTSTSVHSSDINGVKSSGGSSNKVVNVDGEVEKESVVFGQGDKE